MRSVVARDSELSIIKAPKNNGTISKKVAIGTEVLAIHTNRLDVLLSFTMRKSIYNKHTKSGE